MQAERWRVENELQSTAIVERKVMLPMRDGVRLATDIYRPKTLLPYRNQRIIVYCRTGSRAAVALEVLKANGFTGVENGGGLETLAKAGVPVVRRGS